MIHAYNEIYLNDVIHNIADLFDIAINAIGLNADDFAMRFCASTIATGIEKANPNYLSGKSATEILAELLHTEVEYTQVPLDRTPEYWAGWILAYTQWYLDIPFSKIIQAMPFSSIIALYNPYHEASEMKMVEKIQALIFNQSPLKAIRTMRNLSQKQLANLSGVKVRSIQCYEQGDIDIRNAGAQTLYALAKTLDCTIEDLIK